MHRLRLRKPSPAMIVAVAALVAAIGGTSYAAFSLPKNSVGTKQLKKNAVTNSKIKNRAVTASKINTNGLTVPSATNASHATNADNATNAGHATNADQLGGVAASGYQGKSQYALVHADGTIGFQSGGITATNTAPGVYFLSFPRSVEGQPIMVTNWNSPGGAPETSVCGPGGTAAGDANCMLSGIPDDGEHVFVGMSNTSSVLTNHQFYILIEAP
jgi:hypothetical protein